MHLQRVLISFWGQRRSIRYLVLCIERRSTCQQPWMCRMRLVWWCDRLCSYFTPRTCHKNFNSTRTCCLANKQEISILIFTPKLTADLLTLADMYCAKNLREFIIHFIELHCKEGVMETDAFKNLREPLQSEVISIFEKRSRKSSNKRRGSERNFWAQCTCSWVGTLIWIHLARSDNHTLAHQAATILWFVVIIVVTSRRSQAQSNK